MLRTTALHSHITTLLFRPTYCCCVHRFRLAVRRSLGHVVPARLLFQRHPAPFGPPAPSTMRRVLSYVPRPFRRRQCWFRCAMTALALGYAVEYASRNGPQWVPDTDYLHWSTDVPAVSVCQAAASGPRGHTGERYVHERPKVQKNRTKRGPYFLLFFFVNHSYINKIIQLWCSVKYEIRINTIYHFR